jgi:hypothetical protein
MPKKFDPKKDLRTRMAVSEKFARRDAPFYTEETSGAPLGLRQAKIERGEFIDFYDDVTKYVKEVRKTGDQGDFNLQDAERNTVKGRQYLNPNTIGGGPANSSESYKGGRQVRSGTIAGPKTARNLRDLEKAKKMNAERDAKIMMKRRGKGR